MSVASPTPWPHNNTSSGQRTFQARRPFSSNELLALRKKAIEQALNAPPVNTINLQDSSEFTARVRKLASRDADPLLKLNQNGIVTSEPNPVMKGGGTVPNCTSANVLARQQGNVYAASYFNYQPRDEYQSAGCSTLLNDNVTFPKQVVCAPPQFRPAYHVVQPLGLSRHFGWGVSTNNVVRFARGTPRSAKCELTTIY